MSIANTARHHRPLLGGRDLARVRTDLMQVTALLVVILAVGVVLAANRLDSGGVGADIEHAVALHDGVGTVAYDATDDFLVVTVDDRMTFAQAQSLGCRAVLPAIDQVRRVTLFAIYSQEGRLLASWQGCEER